MPSFSSRPSSSERWHFGRSLWRDFIWLGVFMPYKAHLKSLYANFCHLRPSYQPLLSYRCLAFWSYLWIAYIILIDSSIKAWAKLFASLNFPISWAPPPVFYTLFIQAYLDKAHLFYLLLLRFDFFVFLYFSFGLAISWRLLPYSFRSLNWGCTPMHQLQLWASWDLVTLVLLPFFNDYLC